MLADLFFRVRALFRRKAVEAELDNELRFHFEQQVAKYEKTGLTREEALRRVRIEFGGMDAVKDECRDAQGIQLVESLVQDVRYGLRTLWKSPGFTLVALLTLALGIGANTAIFSVVYAVLLSPLPYKDPSRLVVLNETTPMVGRVSVSYPNFLDWRVQNKTFAQMATVSGVGFNLAGITQPESIGGEAVSPNYLSILGVHPFLGRDFETSEEKAGTAPVVLLSYGLWESHFGADRGALGRTITLDGRGYTIIGVLPPNFRSLDKTDVIEPIGVWVAHNKEEAAERGARGDSVVVGRLAPGRSFSQARAEMEGIAARLERAYPGANDQFGVLLQPIRDVFVSEIRPAILILFGAVMFVLLIACANVANLFLIRGAGRSREIALRMAVGATRGRVIRQMLAESFILAVVGGALGLAIAIAGIHGITGLMSTDTLGGATVNLNGMVLVFAGGVVVLSTFLFGLAPALHATKASVQSQLKDGGRSITGGTGSNRWRAVLAVAEVSLALILLVGAGLMMKSLYRLLLVNPGFQPEHVLSMEMSLRTAQYDKDPAMLNFWTRVLDGVRALPGVTEAAVGSAVPLTDEHWRADITVEGMILPKPGSFPHPDIHIVSPDFVSTLGIPLVRGRAFTEADHEKAPPVAMINAMLAERFFNGNALGKRFMFGRPSAKEPPKWLTIVGVVGDTKLYGLANPARFEVYEPLRQNAAGDMRLIVKSGIDSAALIPAIRGVVASVDKDQPIFGIATMKKLVADSVATRRVTLVLLGLFSGLALVLAAIGIYGVISYAVAQRTHEIGIRLALGAQGGDVVRMILAQGATMTGAGVVAGVLVALGLTRLMTKLLFDVSAADPSTFAAVAMVLVLIAMFACYIPARRTLRVDPMIALRDE